MAVRPESADIQQIWFKTDEVLVKYRDHSRFHDISPQDGKKQVDYFELGKATTYDSKTGKQRGYWLPKEYVLLKSAPPNLKAKLQPVRDATAEEASKAQALFRRGLEFGQSVVKLFQTQIKNWNKDSELHMTDPQHIFFRYKDKSGIQHSATIFVRTSFNKDGEASYRFEQVKIITEKAYIFIDRPAELQAAEQKLMPLYRTMLKEFIKARRPHKPDKAGDLFH